MSDRPPRATVRVRVVPRARKTAVTVDAAGALRVHVTAPPVDDAANAAVLGLLAEHLGVHRRDLMIAQGAHGREKVIAVEGLDRGELARPVRTLTRRTGVANRQESKNGALMPIYEYSCPKCGDFETMQKMSDPELTHCPTCRRKVRKLISSTSFQLKGSGWYVTDYARKGGAANKDKKPDAKKSEDAAGSDSSASSDSSSTATSTETPSAKPSGGKTGTKAEAA